MRPWGRCSSVFLYNAGAAFLRRLSFYFDILFIDAVFMFFNERKQRAFDKLADTMVIIDQV